MKYELTKDLETGNTLIDSEHRQLFAVINKLLDACSQGKGRDQITSTVQYLNDYVSKHLVMKNSFRLNQNILDTRVINSSMTDIRETFYRQQMKYLHQVQQFLL